MKRRVREALNIHISYDISNYLGCLIIQGRVKKSTFSEVISQVPKNVTILESLFPFKDGKITLIKANLESSHLHVMNFFKLMKRNNEDLDRELIEISYGYQR